MYNMQHNYKAIQYHSCFLMIRQAGIILVLRDSPVSDTCKHVDCGVVGSNIM